MLDIVENVLRIKGLLQSFALWFISWQIEHVILLYIVRDYFLIPFHIGHFREPFRTGTFSRTFSHRNIFENLFAPGHFPELFAPGHFPEPFAPGITHLSISHSFPDISLISR